MAIAKIKEISGFVIHTAYKTKIQNQAIQGLELEIGDQLSISIKAKCKIEYNNGKIVEFVNQSTTYEINETDAGSNNVVIEEKEPEKVVYEEPTPIATGVISDEQEVRVNSTISDNTQVDEYFESIKEEVNNKNQRLIPIPRILGYKEGVRDGSLEIILPDNGTMIGDSLNIQYKDAEGDNISVIYKKVAPNLWEKEPYPRLGYYPNRSDEGSIIIKSGGIPHNTEVDVNIVTNDLDFGEIATARVFDEEKDEALEAEENKETYEEGSPEEETHSEEYEEEDDYSESDDESDNEEETEAPANDQIEEQEDILSEEKYRDQRLNRSDDDFKIELDAKENNEGDRYTIIYLIDGTEKMVSYVKNSNGRWSLEKEDAEGVFSDSKEVTSVITYYYEDVKIKELIYEPFRESQIELKDFDKDGEIDYQKLDQSYTLSGFFNKNMKLVGNIEGKVFIGNHKHVPLKFIAPKNDEIFYAFEVDIPKEYLLGNDLIKIEINYARPGDIDITTAEEEIEYYLINDAPKEEENQTPSDNKQDITQDDEDLVAKEEENSDVQEEENDSSNNPDDYADLDPILVNRVISLKGAPENGLIFLFIDAEGAMPRIYSIENNAIRKGEDDIGSVDDGVANFIVGSLLVRANSEINIQAKFYKA